MTDVGFIYAIKSRDAVEIKKLENPEINE